MPIVLKTGSLNLLEPSGPVQARNGIALPLPYYRGSAAFMLAFAIPRCYTDFNDNQMN